MFMRLWWRAISVKRSQALLAASSLMVGAAVAAMLLSLYSDVRRKMTEDFRAYGANVVIAPSTGRDFRAAHISGQVGGEVRGQTSEVLDETAVQPAIQVARQIRDVQLAPVLYGVVRVSPSTYADRTPASANVIAVGTDFGVLRRLNAGWHIAGGVVSEDLRQCAIGANLAARLHLQRGDSLTLEPLPSGGEDGGAGCGSATLACEKPSPFRISTILTTGASEDDQVFIALPSLQSLLRIGDKITLVELSIPGDPRDVEAAIRRLAGTVPGLDVRPIRQIVYSEGRVLGAIRWLLLSLTILILVIIALCVMATMTAIVLERRKDVGVMKALGAADALVVRLFMAEGASLGLVAGLLGYAAGILLARGLAERLFGVALRINAWTLPLVCAMSVVLASIAALAPLRIVRSIQPTVVLKGE